MRENLPTKANLLAAKHSRDLAKLGASLLDKKQHILSRELAGHQEKAQALRTQMEAFFSKAQDSLQAAHIVLGQCDRWAQAVEPDDGLTLHFRSFTGVELPVLSAEDRPPIPAYGFTGTESVLDEALICFTEVKILIRDLAQAENAAHRLTEAVRKTGKGVNALNRVVIPRLDRSIRQIEEVLAQRELEAFVRQKHMKKRRWTLK